MMSEQPARPVNHSARRIGKIAAALRAQRYLEIGVSKGATFLDVTIPERTGVDPRFLFDTVGVIDAGTRLEAVTSDVYFSTLPVSTKFDVIFIDGLHTFEQTYRDLCNALSHSHDSTVILLDDTKPSDVFSSLRIPSKAVQRRKEAGGKGDACHGDAYKVAFAIHDFHPGLNYRTIVGSGNSQTLVWRSNNGWRNPRYDSLEVISRLDYFALLDNLEVLRESPEDAAITQCLRDLGATAESAAQA